MKLTIASAMLSCLMLLQTSCGPNKAVRYYNLGVDAVNRDNYNEAIADWNESLKYRPDDPDTRFNLGSAYLKVNRYAEAETQLRRAVELRPADPDAHELLGESLEKQGKLPEAKQAYQFALSVKGNHVPSLIGLARVALAEDQNKSAEDYATQAADLDPNNIDANLALSEAYFRRGDYNAAYAQLLAARRLGPTNPELMLLLGKVGYARRMYGDALQALGDARRLGETSEELFRYLGLTNLAVGDVAEAEKQFHLAIFKDESNVKAWQGLAETFIAGKKWTDAAGAVAQALKLAPDDPETALDHAIVLMGSGDPAAAVRVLEPLQEREDAPKLTGYYLGHAYLRTGDKAKARQAFEAFAASWQGDRRLTDEARAFAQQLAR